MSETEAPVTEATTESTPEAPAVSDYDAQVAAAKAATGDEPAPAAPETPTEAAPVEEEKLSKIGAVIRAREKAQEIRDTSKSDAERIVAEATTRAQEAADRILADARKQAAEEQAAWKSRFKASPLEAIKAQGIDTRTLVDEVQREGTPEWQAQKRYEAKLEALEAKTAGYDKALEAQQAERARYDQDRQAYARQQTEAQFLALLPAESAARSLYDDAELIAKAHTAADLYREKSGQVASLEDLRDYLEDEAAKRLAKVVSRHQPGGATAAQQAASKVSANQPKASPRALSGASASERRTSPRPRSEWTDADLQSEMKAAADAAIKQGS
jgi:hypothetical protein